ncbi:MAG: YfhO family protein [Clostridia bacterium]|nr:YfhO family protein [Clostridia bacterium]
MKQKLKTFFKEYGYLALAFAVPFVLLMLIYGAMKIYPIGDGSVLVLDLNAQYIYFYDALRDIVREGGSFLYTWGRALGGEFMGIFAYYLASPFSFIVSLFPDKFLTEAVFLITLLKCGAQGLTFGYYLHKSHPGKKISIIIFSCLYALTSYTVVYGQNIMWMDALIFLPLIVLGIERLIDDHKFGLYTVCIAYVFIANFYIGYMIAIFSVIYAVYYYYSNNPLGNFKKFFSAVWRFVLFSLIAAMIAAVILLPTYYSLKFGKTDFQETNYAIKQQFDFFDLFAKSLPATYDTIRPEGLPIVYCGLLSLILLPLYFLAKDISPKKKAWAAVMLSILVFSFNTSTIDIFWHGLSMPNWMNYRYSFVFTFMLIIFAYEAFCRLETASYRPVAITIAVIGLLVCIVQKFEFSYIDDFSTIWLSLILLIIYAVTLFAIHKNSLGANGRAILAIIVCFELFISGYSNLVDMDADVIFSDRSTYRDYIDRLLPLVSQTEEKDPSLYRMEKTLYRQVNDCIALGMNGLSGSTSTLNAASIKVLEQLGYASHSHWSRYLGQTPVADSILGVKYVISQSPYNVSPLYVETGIESETETVMQNPYAMQIASTVGNAVMGIDFDAYESPMERMNALFGAMLGYEYPQEIFKPIEIDETTYENVYVSYIEGHADISTKETGKSTKILFELHAPTEDGVFMYIPTHYPREVNLYKNGQYLSTYFGNESRRIADIGSFEKDELFYVSMELGESNQAYYLADCTYFWYLDTDLFKSSVAKINENGMKIDSYDDTHINGTITITNTADTLFTTIPYDEGWIVEIDSKRVPLTKMLGAFCGVNTTDLAEGEHTITFRYLPSCVIYGNIISVCGILALIGAFVLSGYLKKRKTKVTDGDNGDGGEDAVYMPLDALDKAEKSDECDTVIMEISEDGENGEDGENCEDGETLYESDKTEAEDER